MILKLPKSSLNPKENKRKLLTFHFKSTAIFFLDREARGLQLVKYASFAPLNSLSEKFKDNSGVYFHRRFTLFCNSFSHN